MNNDIEVKRVMPVPSVPFGYKKMFYAPTTKGDCKKIKSFTMFVKKEGDFKDGFPDDLFAAMDLSVPVVALDFKNKKSINDLITMLEWFRDYEYNKSFTQMFKDRERVMHDESDK